MRIMYVEDNIANVALVRRVARGHELINYIDGEDALKNFEKNKPDLVLMDVQLSGRLDGLEVVGKLRAAGHKTPIVAVTAYAMIGDRERCLAIGCDDYMAKPLDVGKLVALFKKYAEKIEAGQPAAEIVKTVKPASELLVIEAGALETDEGKTITVEEKQAAPQPAGSEPAVSSSKGEELGEGEGKDSKSEEKTEGQADQPIVPQAAAEASASTKAPAVVMVEPVVAPDQSRVTGNSKAGDGQL